MSAPIKVLTAAGLILASASAHANFMVTGGQAQPGTTPAEAAGKFTPGLEKVADEPHLDPGDRQPAVVPRSRPAPKPKPRIVQGFGDQVPLAFACRQIVPSTIKVSYGPGVDPGRLVTWHGGDTWPHVLGNTIKPLGLRLVETGARVEIKS